MVGLIHPGLPRKVGAPAPPRKAHIATTHSCFLGRVYATPDLPAGAGWGPLCSFPAILLGSRDNPILGWEPQGMEVSLGPPGGCVSTPVSPHHRASADGQVTLTSTLSNTEIVRGLLACSPILYWVQDTSAGKLLSPHTRSCGHTFMGTCAHTHTVCMKSLTPARALSATGLGDLGQVTQPLCLSSFLCKIRKPQSILGRNK